MKDMAADFELNIFFGPANGLRHLALTESGCTRPGSLIFFG